MAGMAKGEIRESTKLSGLHKNRFIIYIIFAILVALVVYSYTYYITGIVPSYDDAVYVYSIIRPTSLYTSAVFGGSIGF